MYIGMASHCWCANFACKLLCSFACKDGVRGIIDGEGGVVCRVD